MPILSPPLSDLTSPEALIEEGWVLETPPGIPPEFAIVSRETPIGRRWSLLTTTGSDIVPIDEMDAYGSSDAARAAATMHSLDGYPMNGEPT